MCLAVCVYETMYRDVCSLTPVCHSPVCLWWWPSVCLWRPERWRNRTTTEEPSRSPEQRWDLTGTEANTQARSRPRGKSSVYWTKRKGEEVDFAIVYCRMTRYKVHLFIIQQHRVVKRNDWLTVFFFFKWNELWCLCVCVHSMSLCLYRASAQCRAARFPCKVQAAPLLAHSGKGPTPTLSQDA